MARYQSASELVVERWTPFNLASPPVKITGVVAPTHVVFTVLQSNAANTGLETGPAATLLEIGSTGDYYITYSPTAGRSHHLYARIVDATKLPDFHLPIWEPVFAMSTGFSTVPAFTDSFCSESDVERYAKYNATGGTNPTTTDMASFAKAIAQQLVAELRALGITRTPGDSTSEPETTMLRETNAVGAAWLTVSLRFFGNRSPNRTTLGSWLKELYARMRKDLLRYYRDVQLNIRSTDHVLSGKVSARDDGETPEQDPRPFGVTDVL